MAERAPTSTPPRSTPRVCSGSPASRASTVASIRARASSRCSTRRVGGALTASPRARVGPSGTPPSRGGAPPPAPLPGRGWRLPGEPPMAYAVYVDETDAIWLTDFGANSIVRFDPATETFASFPLPGAGAAVRQLLGRPDEVWGAETGLRR